MHTGKHPQGQEGGKSAFDFYNFMFKLSPNSTSSEAKGPCPRCGGDDRFWIRPDGTFGCRKCNPGKDNPAAYKLIKDELRSLGWNPDGPTPEAGPMRTRGERNKQTQTKRQPNCLRAHWLKKFGPHDHEHAYRTAAGESFSVLRWNADPDKERPEPIIRPSKRALQGPFLPLEYNEIPEGGTLVVCEGERTCDAIRAAGFNATTWKGGTNAVQKTDWSAVRDCKVVLWPDDDEGGRKAMRWLRYRLQSQGCVTHTVETEGLNDGNDAADIKRAGALEGKIQQAMYEADRPELKEADPGDKPEESRAAIPLPRKWVMPENFKMPEQILEYSLQAGSTSLLYGGSGSGKSTIMVSEILSLVTGRALLGGKAPDKTGVMVYEVDESKDGFNSRMIAAMKHHRIDAAEVEDRLFFEDDDWPGALNASDIPKLEDSLDAIAKVMRLNGCRAFYIDALASAAMGVEKDPDIANLVFGLVVQKICRPLNAAVKWVHHSRKKGPGYAEEPDKDEARGTGAIMARSRIAHQMIAVRKEGEDTTFKMNNVKASLFREREPKDFNFLEVPMDGDNTAPVAVVAEPPDPFEHVTKEQSIAITESILKADQEFRRASPIAEDWAGKIAAEHLQLDIGEGKKSQRSRLQNKHRDQIEGMIDGWIAAGLLKVAKRDVEGSKKPVPVLIKGAKSWRESE